MVRSPMADAPTSPRSRASRTSQTRCARSLPWLKCRYARLLCSTQQCVLGRQLQRSAAGLALAAAPRANGAPRRCGRHW
jgi:hypothetical protein